MSPSGRVLVTGAAGLIGTHVCAELTAHGMSVTGMSLSGPFPRGCTETIVGDVTDAGQVASALTAGRTPVTAIVHLAAIPHPSLDTPFEVYRTNTAATFAVLSAAGEQAVPRVVVASSINASGIPFNPHRALPAYYPIDEELPIDLADAYSLSKQSGELAATMAARRWGTEVISLRFPLVKPMADLLRAADQARREPTMTVREGWSYLEVGDAARAVRAALVAPIEGAVVIGLAARETLMNVPTAELLDRYAAGVPVRRELAGFSSAVDTTRARELLGFTPAVSIPTASIRQPAEGEFMSGRQR